MAAKARWEVQPDLISAVFCTVSGSIRGGAERGERKEINEFVPEAG
jgi:hypothetical protein